MADEPQLHAYIVALSFAEGGPLYVNAHIAPNEVVATAMIAVELFQRGGGTDKPLTGVSVVQLVPEFMRMAVRASEGTLSPDGKNVVALVPQPTTLEKMAEEMRDLNPAAFKAGVDWMEKKRAAEKGCQHDWVDGRCSLCFKPQPCQHGALRGYCSICYPERDRSEFPNGRIISRQEHLAEMAQELHDTEAFCPVHKIYDQCPHDKHTGWRPDDPLDPVA